MDGHQVDRVERLDHGVRLVACRQRVEVSGHARQRRVAAILDAPDEAPHLLQVLPCLRPPRPAQLVGVGAVGEDRSMSSAGGMRSTCASQPGSDGAPSPSTRRSSSSRPAAAPERPALEKRTARVRRQHREAAIRQPDEPRPQERGRAQVRRPGRQGSGSAPRGPWSRRRRRNRALVDVGRDARASSSCSNSRWLSRERNRMAMSPGRAWRGTPVFCRARCRREGSARSRRRRRRARGGSSDAMAERGAASACSAGHGVVAPEGKRSLRCSETAAAAARVARSRRRGR